MKLKNLLAIFSLGMFAFSACTPDETSMGTKDITPSDLNSGVGFDLSIDQSTNIVTMTSKMDKQYQTCWITSDGYSVSNSVTVQHPFKGKYYALFGCTTRGGVVFSDTCWYNIENNKMDAVDNDLYKFLTGGAGKKKTWIPCNQAYGVGIASSPLAYASPDDNKDFTIGNLKLNWDPGYQSWLNGMSSEDDYYMKSSITFGLSDSEGCTVEETRYENENDATGTTNKGTFAFNISDPSRPTITFNNCYAMHASSFDEVCDNYTKDIKIAYLDEYMLSFATMRTNSEGPWWLVWTFVAKDVKDGEVEIPVVLSVAEANPVVAPAKLTEEDLLTREVNGATATMSEVTYVTNDEQPFNYYWWDGGAKEPAWTACDYSSLLSSLSPKIANEELLLYKQDDDDYRFSYDKPFAEKHHGTFEVEGNVIKFYDYDENTNKKAAFELTFVTTNGENISSSEFVIVKQDIKSGELILGLADKTNKAGSVCQYRCVILNPNTIGGNTATKVDVDQAKVTLTWPDGNKGDGHGLRIVLYNSWTGTAAINVMKAKIKKGQTMTVNYKVEGIEWNDGAKPMAYLYNNSTGDLPGWDVFDKSKENEMIPYSTLDISTGEGTCKVINTGTSTIDFSNGGNGGSLQICLQVSDGTVPGEDNTIDTDKVKVTITSIVIE